MSLFFARVFAALVITFPGSSCFQWTADIPDGTVKYACVGDVLRLPWDFTTSSGDVILSMQWLFEGFSQEIIALDVHGTFVPTPSFSNRVQLLANAGLVLNHVTQGDTGNYTVEISGHDASGMSFTSRRTVAVQVMDNNQLMTSDGELHAQLEPKATYSNTTGRWSLVLSCGTFTYLSDPPFTMEWQRPSGLVVPSDGYTDGHFLLHVTSGGDYTCRIPQQASADVCLHNASSRHATLHVDKMDARVTLIEARQEQLEELNNRLFQSLQNLTSACAEGKHTIIDDVRRDVNNTAAHVLCDNTLAPAWYRFKLNGTNAVIPVSCVPENHCGTTATMWLDQRVYTRKEGSLRPKSEASPSRIPAGRPSIDRVKLSHWHLGSIGKQGKS